MYEVYVSLVAINFILLSIFTYEDIKSRAIKDIPVYASVLFLIGILVYSFFTLKILLVFLLSIFGLGIFIYSKKTGNVGEGDVPILLSTLLIIILASKLLLFIYFLIIFTSVIFTLPIIIYKKTFNAIKRYTSVSLFIILVIFVLFNKIEISLVLLMAGLFYALFSTYGKIDILYEESVKKLNPSKIVPGDLIVNSLLINSQKEFVKSSGRLTLVTKDLLKKLDKKKKYPIYHNSLPMTVPIFIAFLIAIIWLVI